MTTESDLRLLKQQVTLMSAALHALARACSDQQKAAALSEFETTAQYAQAHVEASQTNEEELSFFLALRQSIEQALSPQSMNQGS